ncbi:MAG TPA: hypothetical protein VJC16_06425 [Candidatus Nanoarchaeia archaeon]|nr:hypothetical protein [Candidatus Nanoarchaeia archaeon]
MPIEEYASVVIPAFVTLGSLGALYPYLVEGFIIFSFVLYVLLFLAGKLFERIKLRGYYDIFLASLSIIFAFSYLQKDAAISLATGMVVLVVSLYIVYYSAMQIKWAS